MKKLILFILLGILISCSYENCITGNSNYIDKSLVLPEFENVVNSFPGAVVLKYGSSVVNFQIEENIEDKVIVNIEDNTLRFSQKDEECFESNGIYFEIFSPSYSELKNNGSADWTSEYLEFNPKIISNGSGDIVLTGSSINQSVMLNGSGNVDLSKMPTENIYVKSNSSGRVTAIAKANADVIINGSGYVEIDSLFGVLNLEINGSGNLLYSGEPEQIKFESNGSGKLIKK